jgi:hypothetical protein
MEYCGLRVFTGQPRTTIAQEVGFSFKFRVCAPGGLYWRCRRVYVGRNALQPAPTQALWAELPALLQTYVCQSISNQAQLIAGAVVSIPIENGQIFASVQHDQYDKSSVHLMLQINTMRSIAQSEDIGGGQDLLERLVSSPQLVSDLAFAATFSGCELGCIKANDEGYLELTLLVTCAMELSRFVLSLRIIPGAINRAASHALLTLKVCYTEGAHCDPEDCGPLFNFPLYDNYADGRPGQYQWHIAEDARLLRFIIGTGLTPEAAHRVFYKGQDIFHPNRDNPCADNVFISIVLTMAAEKETDVDACARARAFDSYAEACCNLLPAQEPKRVCSKRSILAGSLISLFASPFNGLLQRLLADPAATSVAHVLRVFLEAVTIPGLYDLHDLPDKVTRSGAGCWHAPYTGIAIDTSLGLVHDIVSPSLAPRPVPGQIALGDPEQYGSRIPVAWSEREDDHYIEAMAHRLAHAAGVQPGALLYHGTSWALADALLQSHDSEGVGFRAGLTEAHTQTLPHNDFGRGVYFDRCVTSAKARANACRPAIAIVVDPGAHGLARYMHVQGKAWRELMEQSLQRNDLGVWTRAAVLEGPVCANPVEVKHTPLGLCEPRCHYRHNPRGSPALPEIQVCVRTEQAADRYTHGLLGIVYFRRNEDRIKSIGPAFGSGFR